MVISHIFFWYRLYIASVSIRAHYEKVMKKHENGHMPCQRGGHYCCGAVALWAKTEKIVQ